MTLLCDSASFRRMNYRASAIVSLLACLTLSNAQPAAPTALSYHIEEIAAPAPISSSHSQTSPTLARGPDGQVWMLWHELAENGQVALRCAAFDDRAGRWSKPSTVAVRTDWITQPDDPPALTAGSGGQLVAAASIKLSATTRQVLISRSSDHGRTWSTPTPVTPAPATSGFPALTTLADQRTVIGWIGQSTPATAPTLFARILEDSTAKPDTSISSAVNETSAPALTAFPDGSALISYRGRTADNIRDPYTARLTAAGWSQPRALNVDAWRDAQPAGSTPRIANDGGRVSAAWFTHADNQPRVLLTTSADAGTHFLLPMKADLGRSAGPVETVLLHDGAALVLWVEKPSDAPRTHPGGVWIRRASPQSTFDSAIPLAVKGFNSDSRPRAALLQDHSETNPEVRLLVTFGGDSLHTLRVTVPESALLAAATEACGCGGAPAQLTGFPFRGTLVSPVSADGILVAKHLDLPGLLLAGSHRFRVAPGVATGLTAGQEFIGHVEQRGNDWWLSDLRALVAPPN